ncbi:hypothetical protein ACF0H5_010071 [Mactra antiquata]
MQAYFSEVLTNYDKIRGCKKSAINVPFWDVIIITAADDDQKNVYEKQLEYKYKRSELPKDIPILVVADPPGPKIGNGGSTMVAMDTLFEKYGDETFKYKILLIHAGGQSQRMPSASVLGKIFSPIPKGNPVYQMLDLKLAMFLPLIDKMESGVFVTCADDFLVYDLGKDHDKIQFGNTGFTALAHPSSISVGTGHGVYVISGDIDTTCPLQSLECLEVLQKPTIDVMYSKGAVIKSKDLKFSDEMNLEGSVVYTDSSFYFAHDVTKKLLAFMNENKPLDCEIDAYGDFLQALGPRATSDYVNNIANVSCSTKSLIKTRREVFNLLHDSDLTLLVMNSSKFVHIGTTQEYISHFCCDTNFQSELGLEKDVFNLWTEVSINHGTSVDDHGNDGEPLAKYRKVSDTAVGCIMQSCLPLGSSVSSTAVVEFCYFSVPVKVGQHCILSNCEFDASMETGQGDASESKEVKTVEIPNNLFMHTIPVKYEEKVKYVTVFFDIKDNLKKVSPSQDVSRLPFLGKVVEDYASLLGVDLSSINSPADNAKSKPSLWFLNLFPVMNSASESILLSLKCINAIKKDKSKTVSLASYQLVSMATILRIKDVNTMLRNRDLLYKKITNGHGCVNK